MKNKVVMSLIILVLILITAFVYNVSESVPTRRVHFQNQEIKINQSSSVLSSNNNVELNSKSVNLENKSINTNSKDIHLNNIEKIKNENYSPNRDDLEFSDINNHNVSVNNSKNISNKNYTADSYRNIDWRTWKSNFVNKFLEDSLYIKSLDEYGKGTWFYYSFDVNFLGEISNIKVFSLYLTSDDRQKIKDLIMSYQFTPITAFPANSRKEKEKVKAIVLLSDEEVKTKPSDFNDYERVKINY